MARPNPIGFQRLQEGVNNITVPAGTLSVLVGISWWDSANNVNSMTPSSFVDGSWATNLVITNCVVGSPDNSGIARTQAKVTATGPQTITIGVSGSGTLQEGATGWIVYLDTINPDDYLAERESSSPGLNTNPSVSLVTDATEGLLVVIESNMGNSAVPSNVAGWTSLDSYQRNFGNMRLRTKNVASNPETVNGSGDANQYLALTAWSIKPAAAGPTIVTGSATFAWSVGADGNAFDAVAFDATAFDTPSGGGPTIVSATQGFAWSVRNLTSATRTVAWSVRNLASATRTIAWSVRNLVSTSQGFAWTVRNGVSTTQALAWSVRNLASATQGLAWSVEAAGTTIVSATQALAWSVRNQVSAAQSIVWTVRNGVSSTQALAWSVRSAVSTTQGLAWSVRNFANASRTVAWSVRSYTSTTQPIAWRVWNTVAGSQTISWSVESNVIPDPAGFGIFLRRRRRR